MKDFQRNSIVLGIILCLCVLQFSSSKPALLCFVTPIWVAPGAYAEYVSSGARINANATILNASIIQIPDGFQLRWEVLSVDSSNATILVNFNATSILEPIASTVTINTETREVYYNQSKTGVTWFWISGGFSIEHQLHVASLILPSASIQGDATIARVRTPQGHQQSIHTIIENVFFFDYTGLEFRSRAFSGSWEYDTGIFSQGAGDFLMPSLVSKGILNIATTLWFVDTNIDLGPEINWLPEVILPFVIIAVFIGTFVGIVAYLTMRSRRKRRRKTKVIKRRRW